MKKRSILYLFPQVYIWGLKLYHRQHFNKRYQYIASITKKGDTVLEAGCGPAILKQFLPSNISYEGFDLNEDFLAYAKRHGRKVYKGDVLDSKSYKMSDVIVAVDMLHHLSPKTRKKFIQNCWKFTKKALVICEPGTDPVGDNWLDRIKNSLATWSEQDGTNEFHVHNFITRPLLRKHIAEGFGVIDKKTKRQVKEFGQDLVVVYSKKG